MLVVLFATASPLRASPQALAAGLRWSPHALSAERVTADKLPFVFKGKNSHGQSVRLAVHEEELTGTEQEIVDRVNALRKKHDDEVNTNMGLLTGPPYVTTFVRGVWAESPEGDWASFRPVNGDYFMAVRRALRHGGELRVLLQRSTTFDDKTDRWHARNRDYVSTQDLLLKIDARVLSTSKAQTAAEAAST